MADESAIAMQVNESNGEISASVEETNRIRAQLGLKPLAAEGGGPSKEAEAKVNGEERQRQFAKEEAEEAMREKLDAARRQRLLHQKLKGKSLGEQLAGEEMDSAAAWVMKSRTQEEVRKEKKKEMKATRKAQGKTAASLAAQSARYDEEDEMGQLLGLGGGDEGGGPSSALAGAVVGHGVDDFKAGESVVLTLADQSIVGEDGDELNDDAEMLENVNLAEQYKRDKVRAEARGDNYKYNPYEGTGVGAMLSKYDDGPARQTLTLDDSGGVDEAKQKKLAAIRARLAATQAGAGGDAYDLGGGSLGPARTIADGNDYLSREEAPPEEVVFKKRSKDKGGENGENGEKKKKKLRKKVRKSDGDGMDLDAMAAEEAARSGGGGDHGSAAARQARVEETQAAKLRDQAERRANYDQTLAAADVKSKAMEFESYESKAAAEEEEAEVDAELYAALARARRLASSKTPAEGSADLAAHRLAATLAATEKLRAANEAEAEEAEEGVELSSLEFSETGEFCKAVRAKDEVDSGVELPSQRLRESLKAKEQGTTTSAASLGRGEGGSSGVQKEEAVGAGGADGDDNSGDDEEEDDQEEEGGGGDGMGMLRERMSSGGLGAVLDVARNRGMLSSAEEKAGRMFDQKGAGLHQYGDAEGGIKDHAGPSGTGDKKGPSFVLEHYDEYGRAMTAKQAFRQLSWKFHGKAPSKKNREKRMVEAEKQLAERREDKAMGYMDALQKAQQNTKSAHVVLTGIHAIKPSEIGKAVRAEVSGGEPKKKKPKPS